nr:NAD(P)/FAD-dependent oxidoreductase [uncultured Holophaga sp.]
MLDVVIAGGGPAGGHLARLLAGRGRRVLLAEAIPHWQHNAFSSAGLPIEALERWDIPRHLAKAWWRGLEVISSHEHGLWMGPEPRGAVLDFGELRAHLAGEARARGAELRLGTRLVGWDALPEGGCRVRLACGGQVEEILTRVLVDATGPARAAFGMRKGVPSLYGVGLEYLVEVEQPLWERFGDRLAFYMGQDWAPGGYGWVFPMAPGRLKVGAGVFSIGRGKGDPALRPMIQKILDREFGAGFRLVETHGGLLRYTRGMADTYAHGPVLAIGDAVSTVNVLGGEGIRFAMEGAEIALPFVEAALEGGAPGFPGYEAALKRRFLKSWKQCEALAIRKYLEEGARFDRVVAILKRYELELLMEILFHYRFTHALLAMGPRYLLGKLWRMVRGR